jgi:FtsP/CotA-like multicopper oxidase with cupredoxin domain
MRRRRRTRARPWRHHPLTTCRRRRCGAYEIPVAIQDRPFNADGSLFYPDTRAFFDGFGGPYIPDSDVSPIRNPEFFANTMVVNGRTWPVLEVEPRRYRFSPAQRLQLAVPHPPADRGPDNAADDNGPTLLDDRRRWRFSACSGPARAGPPEPRMSRLAT